jgi:hypothetical protein
MEKPHMNPQTTQALIGAVIALLTAAAGYLARPKVDRALERRRARRHIQGKAEPPVIPPEAK